MILIDHSLMVIQTIKKKTYKFIVIQNLVMSKLQGTVYD